MIGFGSGLSRGEDQARLAKIASDTGGKYFPLPDSSALQSVINQIETTLTCQSPPTTFSDAARAGQDQGLRGDHLPEVDVRAARGLVDQPA